MTPNERDMLSRAYRAATSSVYDSQDPTPDATLIAALSNLGYIALDKRDAINKAIELLGLKK